CFFFSSRRRHTSSDRDWSSDVCSSDLKRRQAAEQAIKSAGGKLEAFYFAFGENDAFVIIDAADHATVASASLAINASGAVHSKTDRKRAVQGRGGARCGRRAVARDRAR